MGVEFSIVASHRSLTFAALKDIEGATFGLTSGPISTN